MPYGIHQQVLNGKTVPTMRQAILNLLIMINLGIPQDGILNIQDSEPQVEKDSLPSIKILMSQTLVHGQICKKTNQSQDLI